MASKRSPADANLQKVGKTWYARVRVPRTLEKYVGQTHLRKSLRTGDKAVANRLKHGPVGSMKAELAQLRSNPTERAAHGISFTDALQWKASLKAAEQADDDRQAAVIRDLIHEKAGEHERLHGTAKAVKWHRAAIITSDTLPDLMAQWLAASDYRESTKAGHRKALSEVLAFVENDHAVPADITLKIALKFLDSNLTQRGLAHATIGDRLISLGGFWQWMASREVVPQGFNPWAGHKVSKEKNKGRSPTKRTYTDSELQRLIAGNATVSAWPTYAYLPDLVVLGLFSGARIDELCSLTAQVIHQSKGYYTLHIADSKTKAGIRYVVVTHAAPSAVLKRRLKGLKGAAPIFPELIAGGLDSKLSSSAVKAYGRYRRACDVPDGTDFHSFRRNVITVLESAGVGQVPIARFVGHKVGTMAGDTYSAGGTTANALATSRKVRYGAKIEAAALALATRSDT